jgi:class 3 adenylate cyclase
MELAEQVDPEEWHRILDRFFEILTEGVHRFEGTVNQYTGDGVMALFGAPLAHEDHAHRACYAALTMQEGIRRYGDQTREREGVHVLARVGLHSGEVVVGTSATTCAWTTRRRAKWWASPPRPSPIPARRT